MKPRIVPNRRARLIMLLGLLVAALALLMAVITTKGADNLFAVNEDFIEYWGAARLNWAGQNPYDPAAMLALQRNVGWSQPDARMMWNPPYLLPLIYPFALLPYPVALMLWRVIIVTVILLCAGWRGDIMAAQRVLAGSRCFLRHASSQRCFPQNSDKLGH